MTDSGYIEYSKRVKRCIGRERRPSMSRANWYYEYTESCMSTLDESSANAAQIEYWNSTAAETWALFQEQLDRQIAPLGLEALRALAPATGEAVIDIGCGCGQTSFELARRVGREGHVARPGVQGRSAGVRATRASAAESQSR